MADGASGIFESFNRYLIQYADPNDTVLLDALSAAGDSFVPPSEAPQSADKKEFYNAWMRAFERLRYYERLGGGSSWGGNPITSRFAFGFLDRANLKKGFVLSADVDGDGQTDDFFRCEHTENGVKLIVNGANVLIPEVSCPDFDVTTQEGKKTGEEKKLYKSSDDEITVLKNMVFGSSYADDVRDQTFIWTMNHFFGLDLSTKEGFETAETLLKLGVVFRLSETENHPRNPTLFFPFIGLSGFGAERQGGNGKPALFTQLSSTKSSNGTLDISFQTSQGEKGKISWNPDSPSENQGKFEYWIDDVQQQSKALTKADFCTYGHRSCVEVSDWGLVDQVARKRGNDFYPIRPITSLNVQEGTWIVSFGNKTENAKLPNSENGEIAGRNGRKIYGEPKLITLGEPDSRRKALMLEYYYPGTGVAPRERRVAIAVPVAQGKKQVWQVTAFSADGQIIGYQNINTYPTFQSWVDVILGLDSK